MIPIFKFSMNDPPLAKGDIGGFSKLLNPPLPPFSKGGGCKQIFAPGNNNKITTDAKYQSALRGKDPGLAHNPIVRSNYKYSLRVPDQLPLLTL